MSNLGDCSLSEVLKALGERCLSLSYKLSTIQNSLSHRDHQEYQSVVGDIDCHLKSLERKSRDVEHVTASDRIGDSPHPPVVDVRTPEAEYSRVTSILGNQPGDQVLVGDSDDSLSDVTVDWTEEAQEEDRLNLTEQVIIYGIYVSIH